MIALLLVAAPHACPSDLGAWKQILGAEWLDCHQAADLTTTNNPFTDPGSLTGMGFPPPGSGTLNSHYTNPASPPVGGLQLDGWFPDACNAFQAEPALAAKDGTPFIPGCTPPPIPGQTCTSGCHHDAQFVIRIPDDWDGHLLSAGTPGIRDAFASDFILSDYALEATRRQPRARRRSPERPPRNGPCACARPHSRRARSSQFSRRNMASRE